jgi:hypothetical protein
MAHLSCILIKRHKKNETANQQEYKNSWGNDITGSYRNGTTKFAPSGTAILWRQRKSKFVRMHVSVECAI